MLQEILVSALTKFQFSHVATAFGKHNVFFGVASRGLFWFIETRKQFTAVLDLTVGCSFKLGRHAANTGSFSVSNQAVIF